jgi:hypothetical protein
MLDPDKALKDVFPIPTIALNKYVLVAFTQNSSFWFAIRQEWDENDFISSTNYPQSFETGSLTHSA